MFGKDAHSISNQLTSIVWDDAIFRTVNEARRLNTESPSDKKGFNTDLMRLFDKGFVISQAMAIRRLTDPNFSSPDKAVISLVRLLDDLEENLHLITRENYISYDGSRFEMEARSPIDNEFFHWEQRQEYFDRLSSVSAQDRNRKDLICPQLFKESRMELGACADFRVLANKFFAHAAEASPKRNTIEKEKKITLNNFDQAYKALIKVSSFISIAILYEHSLGAVLVPQYDHLENLEKPMILQEEFKSLGEFWDKRVKEVEDWNSNIWPNSRR
ncbi:MAG: hypothetical protein ABSB22_26305 [Thermodesulfobacteriota bacterium]|jgi:hypothetical protein